MGFFVPYDAWIIGFCIAGSLVAIKCIVDERGERKLLKWLKETGDLSGISYNEMVSAVGAPTSEVARTNAEGEREFIITWKRRSYSITLIFDKNRKIIAIKEERSN